MATIVPTFEDAQKAANEIRNYMNNGETCLGPGWVDVTFDLDYILQEWCRNHPNDFIKEHNFIHSASTHNWHMYEDRD